MNPMTNVKNIQKLNDKVLQMGVEDDLSWHKQYKDSAYIFIGGLPYDLTEGDILCVFSQYGEIVDINLVRDKSSGKSKGYGFLCYEDQRSTILAVDNFNGIKLGGRTIRVDHVSDYRRPKGDEKGENGERKELPLVGCAPKTPPSSDHEVSEKDVVVKERKKKKKKKEKSKKRSKDGERSERVTKEIKGKRENSPTLERTRKFQKVDREDEQRDTVTKEKIPAQKWEREMNRNTDERSAREHDRKRNSKEERIKNEAIGRERLKGSGRERDRVEERDVERDRERKRSAKNGGNVRDRNTHKDGDTCRHREIDENKKKEREGETGREKARETRRENWERERHREKDRT